MILKKLGMNGRITMKDLASELKLSAPAVAERVRRLEANGTITGYRAIINEKKLGLEITVYINLDIPASNYNDFVEFAQVTEGISEFYYVTGQYSLIIKAFVEDTEHLALLIEKIQAFGTTETSIVMYSNIKDTIF